MRTAEEVLKEKSPFGVVNIKDWQTEAMKEYTYEVAKEALKNGSEDVRLKDFIFLYDYNRCVKSILSETNIPDLK